MGHTLDAISPLYHSLKVNILTVDYRGYGSSNGFPNEKGLAIDADAVINCCIKLPLINKEKIFVYGRSLGAGIAILTALKHKDKIQGIILDTAFTSIESIVKENYPWLSFIMSAVLRNHWPNLDRIQRVEIPIMIITRKEMYESHSKILFDAAKKTGYKEMYNIVEDNYCEEYPVKVLSFILKVLKTYPLAS